MSGDRVKTVLGTMAISTKLNKEESAAFLDFYANCGYNELDTAIFYGSGKTEVVMGQCDAGKNFTIATKANPIFTNGKGAEQITGLTKESVATQLKLSLSRLQTKKVHIFYLHWPDHNNPILETLEAVNEAYTKGQFEIFGISNYASWQVAQICELCKANNWVQPKVYQGMYNVFTRDIEHELIPCLRYYGLSYYAYNPLAGGLLTGKYSRNDDPDTGRFDGKSRWGKVYRERFWNDIIFDAMEEMKDLLSKYNLTILEVSIRWLYHHSILSSKYGDAVILGASSIEHLKTNIEASEKEALPDEIVEKLNELWKRFESTCPKYYR